MSPRTEPRAEIANQMMALEEEKHLQVQLEKVFAEREALRRRARRGPDLSEVVCWKCENTGHYRTSCPEELRKWSEFYQQKRAKKGKAIEPKADSRGTGQGQGNAGKPTGN